MLRSLSLTVVGASGLVGEQVLSSLAASGLPLGRVTAYGSAARSPRVDTVSFGPESLGVHPVTELADVDADVALLCAPPAHSARLAGALRGRVGAILDLSGATGTLFHPAVQATLPEDALAMRIPSQVGLLVVPLLARLVGEGLTTVRGTVALAAGSHGRAAVEELGHQVIAQLTSQDPPRRVFPSGLAFDTLPEDGSGDEWSGRELALGVELAELLGIAPERVGVQVGTFPLFAGATAGLHLGGVDLGRVEELWRDTPGLREVVRPDRLRPRALTGKGDVGWGRLRADPGGDGVHVWLAADPVAVAAALAVEAVGRLASSGLLSDRDSS